MGGIVKNSFRVKDSRIRTLDLSFSSCANLGSLLNLSELSFQNADYNSIYLTGFCVCVCVCARALTCMLSRFSRVQLFATLWSVAHQAPLSMGFFRQEYWSGLSFPSPGDFPHPGIKPASLTSPVLAGGFFTNGKRHLGRPHRIIVRTK